MLIGIDFDNTIVRYDRLFHHVALEKGLIPASVPASKGDVRDYLRSIGGEQDWIELQGIVYGVRMHEADPVRRSRLRSARRGATLAARARVLPRSDPARAGGRILRADEGREVGSRGRRRVHALHRRPAGAAQRAGFPGWCREAAL
jgi:hypothetical protein